MRLLLNDLTIGGANGRVMVAAPGQGVFVLGQCYAHDVSWAYPQPEQYEAITSGDGWRNYPTPLDRPEFELTLRLIGREAEYSDTIPPDLRLAEDMTVRELLGAAYRKVGERG